MNGVQSEDKWQERGDTIKSCSSVNVNTCSMFHDELLWYAVLLEKILHAEKDAHVTTESEVGSGHISTLFFFSNVLCLFFYFFIFFFLLLLLLPSPMEVYTL